MARIRTIKPEFWQNEQLAGLSEHARLLAVALLNHADDEGYFLANQALVRAACFPFEEHSKKVLGSLNELSSVGYIEVRDCSGKSIGFISKFLIHQRIDRPQKSKLAGVFQANTSKNADSSNAHGMFDECSSNDQRLEGKGKEQGKDEEQGTETLTLPELFSELVSYWNTAMGQNCRCTVGRQKTFATRHKDAWFRNNWKAAIDAAAESDFCSGRTDSGWAADLEWFLKPDSAVKLVEGKYANRGKKVEERPFGATPTREELDNYNPTDGGIGISW